MSEILRDNMTKDELIPAASLVVTLGVILAGGYLMSYLVKIEEENVQKTLGAKGLKVRCFIKLVNVCKKRGQAILMYTCGFSSILCSPSCDSIL